MATAPFNINQLLPGDTDIVSQHPGNARTMRDVVESWLLVNHDTNGYHARVDIPRSASPTAPVANTEVLWTSTSGRLLFKHPDGSEEYIGVPPSTIAYLAAGANFTGWLYANGQAVSRTTYADLFSVISTSYGAGDGLTTFNVPDLRGRMLVGWDNGVGRISTNVFNTTDVGGIGGQELLALVAGNIPNGVGVTVSGSVTVSSVTGSISGSSTGSTASGSVSGTASGGAVTGGVTGSVTGTAAVTSTTANTATGVIQSANVTGGADKVFTSSGKNETIASSGAITASFSSGALSGASITSAATVSGSFSGATVSAGTVTGTFSGSGTGTFSGSGSTSGSAGSRIATMPPAMVLYPVIKT